MARNYCLGNCAEPGRKKSKVLADHRFTNLLVLALKMPLHSIDCCRTDGVMSEVINETQQEFWRPPSPTIASDVVVREEAILPTMAEACPRCGTEFLLGSRFCHSCGGKRPEAVSAAVRQDAADIAGLWVRAVGQVQSAAKALPTLWSKIQFPAWLHYLHFHEIKRWIGLPTASLIAFVIGLGCVAGALLVGLLTAKNLVDWQAIQFYRAEWLLAATAAFVAAILLKKPSTPDSE
jgi:hypothetical protein